MAAADEERSFDSSVASAVNGSTSIPSPSLHQPRPLFSKLWHWLVSLIMSSCPLLWLVVALSDSCAVVDAYSPIGAPWVGNVYRSSSEPTSSTCGSVFPGWPDAGEKNWTVYNCVWLLHPILFDCVASDLILSDCSCPIMSTTRFLFQTSSTSLDFSGGETRFIIIMCLWNTNGPAAAFSSHIRAAEQQESRKGGVRDHRELQESEGAKGVKWNKVKEAQEELQWGGYKIDYVRKTDKSTRCMGLSKPIIIWGVTTYGFLGPSRQPLSIPGNDVMVSTSRLEFGFWFLWIHNGNVRSDATQRW